MTVFCSFLCISRVEAGSDDGGGRVGVNCSDVDKGASVREKPEEEKSVQVRVARFAVRAYNSNKSAPRSNIHLSFLKQRKRNRIEARRKEHLKANKKNRVTRRD